MVNHFAGGDAPDGGRGPARDASVQRVRDGGDPSGARIAAGIAATGGATGGDGPRVLVLGADGRLGQFLARAWQGGLPAEGSPGLRPVPSEPIPPEPVPLRPVWQARRPRGGPGRRVVLDPLAEPEALARAVAGADAVLCLAGPTGPEADHGVHAALARAILDARDRAGDSGAGESRGGESRGGGGAAPVILMSSAAIYGRRAGPLDEDGPCAPETAYGRGKLAMERVAAAAGRVHVLRLGNVAGADALLGGAGPGGRKGAAPVTLDRFADGATPSRAYIGPVGLARVLAALLARAVAGRALPPVLNVAAGQVEMAALLAAADLAWTPRPAPAGAIREVRLATGRLDALVALPPAARRAAGMVAEWRRLVPGPDR